MKHLLRCLLLCAGCMPALAPAQWLSLGTHASLHRYRGAAALEVSADTVTMPGVQFGYRPSPRWSLYGWWERSGVTSPRYDDPKLELGLVSARLHAPRLPLQPWLGLGVGQLTLEAETGRAEGATVVGPEAGLDWQPREGLALGIGARALYRDSPGHWDGAVFLTLELRLRLGHNHLPRVQALRAARNGSLSPAPLPPPARCRLARAPYSPRERLVPVATEADCPDAPP